MFKAADPGQSALPLNSLRAAVFDSETTGLNTASDRIVQIGGVRLVSGRIEPDDVFDLLVAPGVPIPDHSTVIHGISNQDVADAADFAAVMPVFADWVGNEIVLGYALGFDLAVLKAEIASLVRPRCSYC